MAHWGMDCLVYANASFTKRLLFKDEAMTIIFDMTANMQEIFLISDAKSLTNLS